MPGRKQGCKTGVLLGSLQRAHLCLSLPLSPSWQRLHDDLTTRCCVSLSALVCVCSSRFPFPLLVLSLIKRKLRLGRNERNCLTRLAIERFCPENSVQRASMMMMAVDVRAILPFCLVAAILSRLASRRRAQLSANKLARAPRSFLTWHTPLQAEKPWRPRRRSLPRTLAIARQLSGTRCR